MEWLREENRGLQRILIYGTTLAPYRAAVAGSVRIKRLEERVGALEKGDSA